MNHSTDIHTRYRDPWRRLLTGLVLLCTLCGIAVSQVLAGPVVVTYSHRTFFNVDPKDAIALTKVWLQTAAQRDSTIGETNVSIGRNLAELESQMRSGEADIAVLLPEEFIQLRNRMPMRAVLATDYGRYFYDKLYLLVRSDSGINKLAQLRGRRLKIESGQKGSMPMQWLNGQLARVGGTVEHGFFTELSEHPKASQVILPVFFGQTDACLVSRTAFEILVEMNPQIGTHLKVLDKSPDFVTAILAVRRDVKNPRRDALLEALQQIHESAKGKQLLTLFRVNRLLPFKDEYLVSSEQILRDIAH